MQRLKARIHAEQAKVEAAAAAQRAQAAAAAAAQAVHASKARINSGFGDAFANAAKRKAEAEQQARQHAAQQAAAGGGSGGGGTDAAEVAAEVARVLRSKSHYDVLQLAPGCGSDAVKKRYKEMSLRLHPDKCAAEGASAAFHRARTARDELLKVVL
jgi:hypothetical protein